MVQESRVVSRCLINVLLLVVNSIINVIIGWEGIGTMEQSYSNYTIIQINDELNKFSYDFLQDEFKHWKKIMKTKPELKK